MPPAPGCIFQPGPGDFIATFIVTVYRINRVSLYNVVGSTEREELVFLFFFVNYSIRLLLIRDPFIPPYKVFVLLFGKGTDFVILLFI